jgi:hypothetical protein
MRERERERERDYMRESAGVGGGEQGGSGSFWSVHLCFHTLLYVGAVCEHTDTVHSFIRTRVHTKSIHSFAHRNARMQAHIGRVGVGWGW